MPQLLSSLREARPLILHFVLTIVSVLVALFLIDPTGTVRVYSLDHRRPHFIDLDGWPRVASIRDTKLLQSDVTTLLSLLASATRAAAAWWAGDLLWRCAFMFMEKSEITLAGFSKVISGGITTILSPRHVSSQKNWFLVYSIIFICFVMDYFSAILTGSITWQSAFTLVDGVVPLRNVTQGIAGSDLSFYRSQPSLASQAIELAASLALVSWGVINTNSSNLPVPSNLTRRAIIQSAYFQGIEYLPPNSTIGTIQIPYFKMEKFEYITHPESTLTAQQWSLLNDTGPYNPYLLGEGFVALFPDASWGPGSGLSLPSPVNVTETRILGIQVERPAVPRCSPLSNSTVPQNVSPYFTSIVNAPFYSCFIFANVTYTAGAAICRECNVVSPTVVQGDINHLQPVPDPLTMEALAITSSVATHITFTSYADPVSNSNSTWEDVAIEFVSRAYQSAWSSLVYMLGEVVQDSQTSVMVAVDASYPGVLRWRVYVWAALHLGVLFGGIAFVYFQGHFHHPWVSDPVTAAFLLDTTGIFKEDEGTDAMDPWSPDAELPVGKLKLNDYDPSRPGKPRTVVLIPTRSASQSSLEQLDGESDSMLLKEIG